MRALLLLYNFFNNISQVNISIKYKINNDYKICEIVSFCFNTIRQYN